MTSMLETFPDIIKFDDPDCLCGHSCKNHFSLGCSRCGCTCYLTWEEYDEERAVPAPERGEKG